MNRELAVIIIITLISTLAWTGTKIAPPKAASLDSFAGKAEAVQPVTPQLRTDVIESL